MNMKKELLDILLQNISLATGCTEPLAVAYTAARVRKELKGDLGSIKSVDMWLDPQIYRNGAYVGIPHVEERGLVFAAALGLAGGKFELGLQAICNLTADEIELARKLVKRDLIKLHIKNGFTELYIELRVVTKDGCIQVITSGAHERIVAVNKNIFVDYAEEQAAKRHVAIQRYSLKDLIYFADTVPIEEIAFLRDGMYVNMNIAEEGLKCKDGLCNKISGLAEDNILENSLCTAVQTLCAAASEARMSGCTLPVMTCAGSGNQGITVFLTLKAAQENLAISEEKLLRSLALACLLTIYIKAHIGVLSAMCGCGVAAGIGASCALVYMLDGDEKQLLGAAQNMVGSISGMVCDGAKEGCAFKLALAAGWAVQSAFLSLRGAVVREQNGIVTNDFKHLIENLGYICNPGMTSTNMAILRVMAGNQHVKEGE